MDVPPIIPDLTLLRRIGAGSYGDVWLARTLTGVYRAVKVVDRARFPDDRPFQRELEGISRFQRNVGDQPRQLALMHVGRIDDRGLLFYVMELADDVGAGTDIDPETYEPLTFKSLLARRSPLPATECVRLGVELARGLVGLHAAGLIHRDVKPSNIILVGGMPKLADIGLVSSREASVTSLGTPGYSPPEGSGSLSADLWGLGRILYELVTGLSTREFPRLPPDFDARDDARVLLELNEVVLRACEPDPKDRYQSAQAMLDDLLLIQAGRSVKDLNRLRARLRSVARAAGVAAAIGAVVIAGLGVKNYLTWRELAAQEAAARAAAEENEQLARYTANLNTAQLAFNSGDLGLARAALRREIPATGTRDRRGIEWYALWNETAGDAERMLGAVGDPPVVATAVSPDGGTLVALRGTAQREIVAWNLADGTSRVLAAGPDVLGGFTADGGRVVVGTPDRTIRLLDVASGSLGPVQVSGATLVSFAGDGRTVLLSRPVGDGIRLWLWDVLEQRETGAWQPGPELAGTRIPKAGISPDRRLLGLVVERTRGAETDFELLVWDLATNSYRFRKNDVGAVNTFQFSSDGRLLAVAAAEQDTTVLDTSDGRVVREFEAPSLVAIDLEFSPDLLHLISGGLDAGLRIWDVASGATVAMLRGHEAAINRVDWSAAGDTIYSGSEDGTIRTWKFPSTDRVTSRAGFWARVLGSPVFAPDGSQLWATLADGRLSRIDPDTLAPVGEPFAAFQALGFAAGGLRALSRDGELVVVDPATRVVERTGMSLGNEASLFAEAASPGARLVVLGLSDGSVVLWNCDERRVVLRERRHESPVWAVAVSPDGRWAASGDRDGNVWLWRPDEGRATRMFPTNGFPVLAVGFSADGQQLVICRRDGSFAIVNPESLAVAATRFAHSRGPLAATFSPDGTRLITAGLDGLVAIWSVPDYRPLGALSFAPSMATSNRAISAFCMSNDGGELVGLTGDGRLRRWNFRH